MAGAGRIPASYGGFVVPFIADQPFWGNVIYKQGLGPKPIPQKRLSVDSLAEAIRLAATDAQIREKALAVGEKIRAEDGVANAVAIIERHLLGYEQNLTLS